MRDAFGGIVNLSMIVVFLVLVCGYLAFNVNYTKAFRVKNYIITTIEQYEGNCDNEGSACAQKISNYIRQIGYSAPDFDLTNDGYTCHEGYCYKKLMEEDDYKFRINFHLAGLMSAEGNDTPEKEENNRKFLADVQNYLKWYDVDAEKAAYANRIADAI